HQEVQDDLAELAGVSVDLGQTAGELGLDGDLGEALGLGAKEHHRVVGALAQVVVAPLFAFAAAAELEQALDDSLAAQRALFDQRERLEVFLAPAEVALHQLRKGEDAAERV